jgi:hypothetical protein
LTAADCASFRSTGVDQARSRFLAKRTETDFQAWRDQSGLDGVTEATENNGPMQFARMGMMQAINGIGTKPTDDGYRPGFRQMLLKNFTWRNIAIFVISLLIVSYLMMLGAMIAVDRLPYVNWDHP